MDHRKNRIKMTTPAVVLSVDFCVAQFELQFYAQTRRYTRPRFSFCD